MKSDISAESIDIFTEYPHLDREIEDLAEQCRVGIQRGSSIFQKKGLAFSRNYDLSEKVVLDAGCGSGLKTIQIAAQGPKLAIGLDGSRVAIERAKRVAEILEIPNVQFVVGRIEDAEKVIGEQWLGKIDFIVNLQNLHHTTYWKENLGVFHSLLRRGGYLICNIIDPTCGRGNFILKNKISYHLGKDTESRLAIGRRLFGKMDRGRNVSAVKEDAFFVDRYSAFYHWIWPNSFVRALESTGFELVDSFPPLRVVHWLSGADSTRRREIVERVASLGWIGRVFLGSVMRMRQFLTGGDNRTYYAVKPVRE